MRLHSHHILSLNYVSASGKVRSIRTGLLLPSGFSLHDVCARILASALKHPGRDGQGRAGLGKREASMALSFHELSIVTDRGQGLLENLAVKNEVVPCVINSVRTCK